MRAAASYQEWRELAQQLDQLDANRLGGRCSFEEEKLYDKKLLEQKLQHMQQVREGGNIREIMFNLRSDLIRNVANIAKRCALVRSWWGPRGGGSAVQWWLRAAVHGGGSQAGTWASTHSPKPLDHPPTTASCMSTATPCRPPSAAT